MKLVQRKKMEVKSAMAPHQVLVITPAADVQNAVTVRQEGTAPYTPKKY